MASKTSEGLTPQKRLFCKAYILTGVIDQSVRIAFPGMAPKSNGVKGAKLMGESEVINYIKELQLKTQGDDATVISKKKQILDELDLISFQDPRNIYPEGTEERKELDAMGPASRTIRSIEITTENIGEVMIRRTVKYTLHDKLKALELRGKNLKLYTDVMDGTGDVVNPTPYRMPDNGMRDEVDG
jgi:hypothetical protein